MAYSIYRQYIGYTLYVRSLPSEVSYGIIHVSRVS